MIQTILALDIASKKTGYAISKNGTITESGVWKLNAKQPYSDLYGKITATFSKHQVAEIVAEDIYKSQDTRKQSAFDVLSQLQGIIRLISEQTNIPLTLIQPSKAKREMWGYTTANAIHRTMPRAEQKERMIKAVQRLGYKLATDRNGNPSNDQADAMGILITFCKLRKVPLIHPVSK